ncbi:hypothetical protein [Streptomyces erythrochromogenes]|uniref:hypothetical protein n=1 Tax=Streptomyces erythrochromogenes TaxID=285574 RepID=UPI00386F9E01|nr:hypothetical protein OG364_06330 [Streptomyces erythrochromogenes]
MTVSFGLLRGADPRYGNRSSGGSVLGLANDLHAKLYGLPLERPALPNALEELLQATNSDDDHSQILEQIAVQLDAAAALVERAKWATNQRLPEHLESRLSMGRDTLRHLAGELREVAPAVVPQKYSVPTLVTPVPTRPTPDSSAPRR